MAFGGLPLRFPSYDLIMFERSQNWHPNSSRSNEKFREKWRFACFCYSAVVCVENLSVSFFPSAPKYPVRRCLGTQNPFQHHLQKGAVSIRVLWLETTQMERLRRILMVNGWKGPCNA